MEPLKIYKTATAVYFKCSEDGILPNGVSLRYHMRTFYEFKFDRIMNKFVPAYKYVHYDKINKLLYIPVAFLPDLLTWIGTNPYEIIEVPPIVGHPTKFGLADGMTIRDHQLDLVDFLANPAANFKALDASTGCGKTFCAITSAGKIGMNTLILTSGLINQWWKELLSKSTLTKQDIWVIQGADSLKKLLDTEGKYKPKVIVASTRTWFMYVTRQKEPYTEFMKYDDFLKMYGIGIKIVDEAHMNFHANLTIDLLTNVQHHLYLSATYERNNKDGARIFNRIFPKEVKYGDHLAKKYTKAYVIGYKLGRELPTKSYVTKEGYNHALFEIAIGRDKNLRYEFYRQTIDRTINEFFLPNRKPGQKCLFICITTGTMKSIARHLGYKFPQLKICEFSADDPDEKITPDIDIIVSTIKKSGTGRDIKNLKVCANLVSYKSQPLIKQVFGRLREIPNEETIFLDFYCKEIEHHRSHVEVRHRRYTDLATQVEIW